jgi:hypothetical protein
VVGERRLIKDKHPLFNNFDAENSLLNNVRIPNKVVQNVRVFVNEDGEQVKNQIQYESLVSLSL